MKEIKDIINQVHCADCLEFLKEMPENSVDAIVTDPPAGINFMSKDWDKFSDFNSGRERSVNEITAISKGPDNYSKDLLAFQNFICQAFTEAIRVLKPGGHALVWAIPRTSHHTAMGLERAGFEIRDVITHVFGSGFPKSLNIGKMTDKKNGIKREVVGRNPNSRENCDKSNTLYESGTVGKTDYFTKGTSEFEGLGTALKPAVEFWWLVRKPLSESTIAQNCLKWGTGGLSIDECRIPIQKGDEPHGGYGDEVIGFGPFDNKKGAKWKLSPDVEKGRFPANLIYDGSDEVVRLFPNTKSGVIKPYKENPKNPSSFNFKGREKPAFDYADNGSASRFFYTAKASRSERNMGCEGLEEKAAFDNPNGNMGGNMGSKSSPRQNNHPTVKPLALMEYLVKLVSRKGQIVLDPFAGSGSTLIAAEREGRKWIGIEKEEDYVKIANARIKAELAQQKLL